MEFVQLDKNKYQEFAKNHKYYSLYQNANWGSLKKENGWDYYYVGLKDKDGIKCAALLLRKKVILNLYLFYSPRGYLIDSQDKDLLKKFQNGINDFIKQKSGFMLKIDPNVIYQIRDKEGNIISSLGEKDLDNYKEVGFKHFGFNLNFETMQPRYICRYKIDKTYDSTLSSFSKSTQKNINKAIEMGVKNEIITPDKVDLFVSILKKSATENGYVIRPTWYYKKMLELFPDEVVYFLTYLDVKAYEEYINKNIKNIENEISDLNSKKEKYAHTGSKMKNEIDRLEESKNRFVKLSEGLTSFKNKGNKIYIGALMSVFTGDEGITFISGTDSEYRRFNIKYAYYDAHLKESIKRKKSFVNFYGISGDLNPDSKNYHIYEIKKGYNPEIIELLGEFDLVYNGFKYFIYKIVLKLYKLLK